MIRPLFFTVLWALADSAFAQPMPVLRLPTDNQALYRGDGDAFYMYVNREVDGIKSAPWQGGAYGMVRGPRQWHGAVVMGHWHEGIDIKPMKRDATGEPLDEVKAIAGGKVVHASKIARDSNYGAYVVVEHIWEGAPYYSLSAHLRAVHVEVGQVVEQGEPLGILGHTGEGLDRERAHLHLELNLLLNAHFNDWHRTISAGDLNKHGAYNGMNLIGLDVARFFLAQREQPDLTVPTFLRAQEPYFAIAFPAGQHFDILKRYPWLSGGRSESPTGAWLAKFTQGGVPIHIDPYPERLAEPKVLFVRPSDLPVTITTKNYITAEVGRNRLTNNGSRFIALLSGNFEVVKHE